MTTKHTPGPWMTTSRRPDTSASVLAQNDLGPCVAMCPQQDDDEEGEQHVVNAHLIAAAPDLLAACEDALEAFFDFGIDESMPVLHGRIRAAIAKAKGGAA